MFIASFFFSSLVVAIWLCFLFEQAWYRVSSSLFFCWVPWLAPGLLILMEQGTVLQPVTRWRETTCKNPVRLSLMLGCQPCFSVPGATAARWALNVRSDCSHSRRMRGGKGGDFLGQRPVEVRPGRFMDWRAVEMSKKPWKLGSNWRELWISTTEFICYAATFQSLIKSWLIDHKLIQHLTLFLCLLLTWSGMQEIPLQNQM